MSLLHLSASTTQKTYSSRSCRYFWPNGCWRSRTATMTEKLAATTSVIVFKLIGLKQRKNIEILKLRFGDAPLQVCEVMLRDMTDSKRIDQHIQSQQQVRTSLPLRNHLTRGALVCCSSNNYFETFLARTASWWSQDAGTISRVRYIALRIHPVPFI